MKMNLKLPTKLSNFVVIPIHPLEPALSMALYHIC